MPSKTKSDVHITPDNVYELIEFYWGYKKQDMFDPCPVDPEWDGLVIPWRPTNYLNAPYGLTQNFIEKAHLETLRGNTTVILYPTSKTDKPWFHQNVLAFDHEIRFVEGRLRFKNDKWQSMNSHMLVRIT